MMVDFEEVYETITKDSFPQNKIYFSDFHHAGGSYHAIGYAIVNKTAYHFFWNHDDGIDEYSIEEDKDAFNYLKQEGEE